MTDFVLRHVVRDVLANSSEADPGEIAKLVMAQIPRGKQRDALEQTMRHFVRQVISEVRISAPVKPATPMRPAAATSSKVAAIRDGWQKRLRDRVHVGSSEWKILADCTYDDLMAAAAERVELAERNQAWARQYRAWASEVLEADVATFGDLPAAVQMQALGAAA